jgi:RNA-directed DNA polymerase
MSIGYESGSASRRRKSASTYFQQRQRKRAARRTQSQDRQEDGEIVLPVTCDHIFSRDGLYESFQQLKHDNGRGAGIDGISYDAISNKDAGTIAGQLKEVIREGEYRPAATRPVKIPKPGKSELRTLQLPVIGDRMVAKALLNAITPRLEQVFLPGSYGFRPKRSFWNLLVDLEARIQTTGMTVVAVADIRQAFDNVVISRAMRAFERLFNEPAFREQAFANVDEQDEQRLLKMIESMMRGHDADRKVGIDQGNPFSPTVLNVLLHYAHDVKHEKRGTSWSRYADNLLYLAQDADAASKLLRHTGNLLDKVKMATKAESVEVVDLATETLAIFGINAHLHDSKLHLALGEQPWSKLNEELQKLHESRNSQELANSVILGWANSYGPACEREGKVIKKLARIAGENGFQEIDWSHVENHLANSRRRFGELRDRATGRP